MSSRITNGVDKFLKWSLPPYYSGFADCTLLSYIGALQFVTEKLGLGNLEDFLRKGRVLDIGCGDAFVIRYLARHNVNIYGIDRAVNDDSYFQMRPVVINEEVNDKVLLADMEHIPFRDNTFNLVTSQEILTDPNFIRWRTSERGVLSEVKRVLVNGGLYILIDYIAPFVRKSMGINGLKIVYDDNSMLAMQKIDEE